MGADLYIKKMNRKEQYLGFEVSKRAVDKGYFRDCYNNGGLFAVLSANLNRNYSWWAITQENKDWFDKNGDLNMRGISHLLAKMLIAKDELSKKDKITYGYENTNEIADKAEYLKWLNLLIDFLQLAIKKKSTVIWFC